MLPSWLQGRALVARIVMVSTWSIVGAPSTSLAGDAPVSPVVESSNVPVNVGLGGIAGLGAFSQELQRSVMDLSESAAVSESDKGAILRKLPNSDMFVYVLDGKSAATLGLIFLTSEVAAKATVVVQEFAIYRDVLDSSGRGFRVGIGIRMVILVNEGSAKVATLGIPQLALAAESKKLQATVRLQSIGLSGKKIAEASPMPAELTFTTLMQMYQAVDTIKKAIWDDDSMKDGTTITPQILGMSVAEAVCDGKDRKK